MKKQIRKLLAVLLAGSMALGVMACGGGDKGGDAADVTGKYICIGVDARDGVFQDPDTESYIELKKGGKGIMNEDGLELDFPWSMDGETLKGSYEVFKVKVEVTGTFKDDVLTILDEGRTARYLKEGAERPDWAVNGAAAGDTENEEPQGVETADASEEDWGDYGDAAYDLLFWWWNGDWYGWWFIYGGSGAYEPLNGQWWDCEAVIDIGNDYTGTLELWDDSIKRDEGVAYVNVSLSTSGTGEHGTLFSEGGWFMDGTLAHADWIIDPGLTDFEDMVCIDGSYEDETGSYNYKIMIRPWGTLWDDVDEGSRPYYYDEWYVPLVNAGKAMQEEIGVFAEDPVIEDDVDPAGGVPGVFDENGAPVHETGRKKL